MVGTAGTVPLTSRFGPLDARQRGSYEASCVDTVRLKKIQQPFHVERLLETLVTRGGLVSADAYHIRDPKACRAGELTSARLSAFDARTKSVTVTGKTGTRTIGS